MPQYYLQPNEAHTFENNPGVLRGAGRKYGSYDRAGYRAIGGFQVGLGGGSKMRCTIFPKIGIVAFWDIYIYIYNYWGSPISANYHI